MCVESSEKIYKNFTDRFGVEESREEESRMFLVSVFLTFSVV